MNKKFCCTILSREEKLFIALFVLLLSRNLSLMLTDIIDKL